jgi:phytoene desaturase
VEVSVGESGGDAGRLYSIGEESEGGQGEQGVAGAQVPPQSEGRGSQDQERGKVRAYRSAGRLEGLLEPGVERSPGRLSCSGVAIYASLREDLPAETPMHSVVLPRNPESLYDSLEGGGEPEETMVFINYYEPGEIYPNEQATLAVLLTAPANSEEYAPDSPFVKRELERASREMGMSRPVSELFEETEVLHPKYFESRGTASGALYGAARPFWRSGPLHRPRYSDSRPWRVGASVHPGGGIPAVLGGAMTSTSRLLKKLGSKA